MEIEVSYAQQRLWFLDQLEPGNPAYNIAGALRLTGSLDVTALTRSLDEIVRRHEALRTSFGVADGRPVQVIAEPTPRSLPLVCLDALPEPARPAAARQVLAAEARHRFDLGQAPLLRATLLRLAGQEHVLVLVMHHIISDGWSLGVLVRELFALYEAFSRGRPSPLSELPIQYADYAVWEREQLNGATLAWQLAYWRRQLADAPASLELPTDRPRPPVVTYRGREVAFELEPGLTARLKELARRENVTLFMTLLAGFQALLSRYTGRDDILVGSPIAGRNRPEAEPLIGFFVNTLVLRTDLSGDPTFRELLARVGEVTLNAYTHQDVPLERLVEELQLGREMSRTPLFQVMFALQNTPRLALQLPSLRLEVTAAASETAKFDLTFLLEEVGGGIRGTMEYNTDLYDEGTVRRMLEHYSRLLEGAAADPSGRVSRLPLLAQDEQRHLLFAWNGRASEYPRWLCVHTLFEQQAARTPDRIAVVSGVRHLTYRQLNERANRLAHRLRALGVCPETSVGVCLERGLEMVVALLGVLKVGGAYLPLDPEHPAERLGFMLEEAGAGLLLTQEHLRESLPRHRAELVCLDSGWGDIEREPSSNPDNVACPDSLAYVMYTSGSTGTPKGVAVPHRGVVRLVRQTNYVVFDDDSVFLQLAPLSFDASTFEIWGCLLNGGRLVVMPPGVPSLDEIADALRRHAVTTLWLTAGLFHQMVEYRLDALSGVRQLLAGGDVLSVEHVGKYLSAGHGGVLINGYGPTENTTFTCCYRVQELPPARATVPIGRPIANTRAYVLDRHLNLCPVGVAGELYAGGDGLTRGYLARPGLTAERYIPHPFGAGPGARLYRTGDLARYLPDGQIEFLGRVDQQVKVRGYRVEPGEVEAALRAHAEVRGAAVVARAGAGGDKQLVAYVVGEEDGSGELDTGRLKEWLRGRLPEYMVPSVYVVLEALPLTPNGKVDRKALPEPARASGEAGPGHVAPRTAEEELVAGIWTEVLGLAAVGVEEDFFQLGGHSLRATQVMARVREAFDVELPLRALFESPTIATLCRAIEEARRTGERAELPAVQRIAREQYRSQAP